MSDNESSEKDRSAPPGPVWVRDDASKGSGDGRDWERRCESCSEARGIDDDGVDGDHDGIVINVRGNLRVGAG